MFGSIIGDLIGNVASNLFAQDRQEDMQSFNAEQAAINRQFQYDQSTTMYQRAVKDMQAAGLNPMLAYHQGGNAALNGSAASGGTASPGEAFKPSMSMQTASQIELNKASEDRLRAEADKMRAEKAEIEARTPTHAVSIDRMNQQIEESKANIQRILAEANKHQYSAINIEQQTKNLQAIIPQIEATVRQLEAQTRLTGAQTTLTGAQTTQTHAQTGLTKAQTEQTRTMTGLTASQQTEIDQRVRQNLPQLQRALGELKQASEKLAMPGRESQAGLQESYIGALGNVLRALNPFSDFMHAAPTPHYDRMGR